MSNAPHVVNQWQCLAQVIARQKDKERRLCESGLQSLLHDLNQNLGIILCAEELLRRTLPAEPDTVELLSSIHDANQKAIEMVRQFAAQFDFSQTSPPRP